MKLTKLFTEANKDDYLVYVAFGVSSIDASVKKWHKNLPLQANDIVGGGSAEFFPDEKSALKAHDKVVKHIKTVYKLPHVKDSEDISFFEYTVMTVQLNGTDISRKTMFRPYKDPYTLIKSTNIRHTGTKDNSDGSSINNMEPIHMANR